MSSLNRILYQPRHRVVTPLQMSLSNRRRGGDLEHYYHQAEAKIIRRPLFNYNFSELTLADVLALLLFWQDQNYQNPGHFFMDQRYFNLNRKFQKMNPEKLFFIRNPTGSKLVPENSKQDKDLFHFKIGEKFATETAFKKVVSKFIPSEIRQFKGRNYSISGNFSASEEIIASNLFDECFLNERKNALILRTSSQKIGLVRQLASISTIFLPSDAISCERAVELGCQVKKSAICIRTSKLVTPVIYRRSEEFSIGRAKIVRAPGANRASHCAVISGGLGVGEALKSAGQLVNESGIEITVIDPFTIKPLDISTISETVRVNGGKLVIVEDTSPEGGLGEAILAALAFGVNPPVELKSVRHVTVPEAGAIARAVRQVCQECVEQRLRDEAANYTNFYHDRKKSPKIPSIMTAMMRPK